MGLFTFVPLAAILAAMTEDEGATPAPRGPTATEASQNAGPGDSQAKIDSPQEAAGTIARPEGLRWPPSADPSLIPPLRSDVDDEGKSPRPISSAEGDAARFDRFDENAWSFDERLDAFDREQAQADEAASVSVEKSLGAALQHLDPEIQVDASCTASVCIVELSSPESVGTMIAKVAPWLRKHTRAATGDPVDASDEHSMRLAFDKSDALVDF